MSSRALSLMIWILLGLALVACQTAALLSRGRLPTIGALVKRLTTPRVVQILVVLLWMWLGWHAFAR
jgi:hypothetical protein